MIAFMMNGDVEGSIVDPHQTKVRAKRAKGGSGGLAPPGRGPYGPYPRKKADGRGR
jgi:hypothetical protein